MDAQIENAIQIAVNPASGQQLQQQALTFLNDLRNDPSSIQACLSLFTRSPPAQDVVRVTVLDVINSVVQRQQLDTQTLMQVRDSLVGHVQQVYGPGVQQNTVDGSAIRNKLTQTLTFLFMSLYASSWPTFFDDFRGLAGEGSDIGKNNIVATILYLRLLQSVHDEIGDVLVPRSNEEQKRHNDLKDLVRERDAQKIAASWQDLLCNWTQLDPTITEACLRTISRWVSWTDISLVVNQAIINQLLEMAGQQGVDSASSQGRVRDAAIDTFTEVIGKKMKPSDKVELIRFLNVDMIVGQLIASPALSELRKTSEYDTDLAESVAKLVNVTVFDLAKVLDDESVDAQTRQRADESLTTFMPFLLRFFADEYDEICSTVIPSLTDILTYFRKLMKQAGALPPHYTEMLGPILSAIIGKMKYDETASWGEEDEQTDEAEFQELRKRLHVLQQQVAAVDEALYIETLSDVIAATFTKLGANENVNWRDVDLALHEMYLFGELAQRNQGLYAKKEPSSVAAERLIDMMNKMIYADVGKFPHPAVQLQFMEICVRYCPFFEQNQPLIPRVLEDFVRLTHSQHVKVRSRSWYLFLKFVRPLRVHLGDVSQTVIQAMGDLLTIKAEVPEENGEDEMSSEEDDQSADAMFTCQLNLFEAIGCIASPPSIPLENKTLIARSVLEPLYADLQSNLTPASNGDERAILQVHCVIMAIGTLARGFSDWTPGTSGAPPPSEVSDEFWRAAEAILVALEALKSSMSVRSAARSAFSRLLGVLGARVLQQLPRWIDGLLSETSTLDEIATFLRLLDQVVFGFKTEIFSILDDLLSPLLQRIFTALATPITGTDDEIQLSELKREYLNFILIILNQGLASVLVSDKNQSNFQTIITTIEHFVRSGDDWPVARVATGVFIRMTAVWGGPDIPPTSTSPAPSLPGFDEFAMSRFSPLSWAVPGAEKFSSKDAQARQVLQELALMQMEILKKCGGVYQQRLRGELQTFGLQDSDIEVYLQALTTGGEKGFKKFFVDFVARISGR